VPIFQFATATCAGCPLRSGCVAGPGGRSIAVHPQEALLQRARAFQASPAFAEVRRHRQTVEHRIARLVQLGLRQALYVGRAKTLSQLAMAAAVANLTLIAAADAAFLSVLVLIIACAASIAAQISVRLRSAPHFSRPPPRATDAGSRCSRASRSSTQPAL
jgi:hypothetical protein